MATNSAGVEYEAVSEPYAETENSVDNRKDISDRLLRIHNVTSNRFWQFAALTGLMFALGIIGFVMRLASGFDDKDVWGYYVAVFAFLMTTTSAAPMVAIAPRIANAHWRRPISRAAELWTVAGCLTLILYIPLIWLLPSLEMDVGAFGFTVNRPAKSNFGLGLNPFLHIPPIFG